MCLTPDQAKQIFTELKELKLLIRDHDLRLETLEEHRRQVERDVMEILTSGITRIEDRISKLK